MKRILASIMVLVVAVPILAMVVFNPPGTYIPNGVNSGDVPIWGGSAYVPGPQAAITSSGISTASADIRYPKLDNTTYVTNNYYSTVTASSFVGDGSKLTGLPQIPAAGVVFYITDADSPYVATINQLTLAPSQSVEVIESGTVTTAVSTLVLLDTYLSPSLNLTEIKAGAYSFFIPAWVNNTGGGTAARIVLKLYKTNATNVSTLLFTTTSNILTTTTYAPADWATVQSAFAVATTNKLKLEVYGYSNVNSRVVSFASGGIEHYSYFTTPILGAPLSSVSFDSVSANALSIGGDRRTAWPAAGGGGAVPTETVMFVINGSWGATATTNLLRAGLGMPVGYRVPNYSTKTLVGVAGIVGVNDTTVAPRVCVFANGTTVNSSEITPTINAWTVAEGLSQTVTSGTTIELRSITRSGTGDSKNLNYQLWFREQ